MLVMSTIITFQLLYILGYVRVCVTECFSQDIFLAAMKHLLWVDAVMIKT